MTERPNFHPRMADPQFQSLRKQVSYASSLMSPEQLLDLAEMLQTAIRKNRGPQSTVADKRLIDEVREFEAMPIMTSTEEQWSLDTEDQARKAGL